MVPGSAAGAVYMAVATQPMERVSLAPGSAAGADRIAVAMPEAVFFAFLQYMAEPVVNRNMMIPRQRLLMAGYDLLALRVVAPNIQRDALLNAALGMFLKYERRESSALEHHLHRLSRQEDRALSVFPWLPQQMLLKDRIRLLARQYRVMDECLRRFLLEHPRMRAAVMRHDAAAAAQIQMDESSTSSDEEDEF